MSLNVLGVISRTLVLFGDLAAGETPDASDAAQAFIALNAMKRAWFGTLIGPRLSSFGLTGTTGQAENGGEYSIPPLAGFTLTAPPNPKAGQRFGILDANLSFNTYNLVIARNGRLINGVAANYTASTNGGSQRFWYRPDTGNWVIEADFAALTSAIEFPDAVIAYMPYMLAMVMASDFSAVLEPEVLAGAAEGRQVLARYYGRRGRAQPDSPLGIAQPQAPG